MIRVMLVEDQAMLRSAIATLLGLEPDIDVVADVGSGDDALTLVAEHAPDVILLDVEMDGASGLDVAAALHEQGSQTLVMMLTTFQRPGYVRRALESGARAYLTKDLPVGDIAAAVRRVVNGEMLISGEQLRQAMSSGSSPLSPRERDVLRAAETNDTVPEIAAALHLSVSTVGNYVTAAITKTDARNRAEAVRVARDRGWL